MYNEYIIANGQLVHAGVKGMKWGVRKKLSLVGDKLKSRFSRGNTHTSKNTTTSKPNDAQNAAKKSKTKRAVKTGAVVAGTIVTAYGAYKISNFVSKNAGWMRESRRLMRESRAMARNFR